jgi:hypothetical protein
MRFIGLFKYPKGHANVQMKDVQDRTKNFVTPFYRTLTSLRHLTYDIQTKLTTKEYLNLTPTYT